MPGNIQIQTTSVPVGFCFTSWEDAWPILAGLLYADADLSVNLHIGDAAPTDLTKAWLKTISGVPDRMYYYASGVWLSKHQIPAGFTVLAPAGTAEADVATLDGGEAGPITAFTGAMWEVDTDFAAKFPIGPGTFDSGAVIVEGGTGGEEKHSLTVAEIPPHYHAVLATQRNTEGGSDIQRLAPNSTASESDVNTANTGGDSSTGLVTAHNTIPPYRARFFIKRSARTHYRG